MKNKKAAIISFTLSLVMHIILALLIITFLKKEFPQNLKPPKQYFVDIITLPKSKKPKAAIKKERHKIVANIQKKGTSKKFSKKEKIPKQTIKATPKIIARLKEIQKQKPMVIAKAPKPKPAHKQYNEKHTTATKQTKKILKRKVRKKAKTIKIPGALYNPKAVISNKTHKGFLAGTSKEYEYKNAKKQATVSLGTQSLKYASYMQHIKDKIQNVWIYPQEAQMSGQQGSLVILFSIGKNGEVVQDRLIRSSGYYLLDNAALQAVKDAAPFPPLPKRFGIDRLNIYANFSYKLGFYYVE